MCYIIRTENNSSHHGSCLYSSDSVSRCSFCCSKGLVHSGYTEGMRGLPSGTGYKVFREVPMPSEAAAFGPEIRVQPRSCFLTVSSSAPVYSPWEIYTSKQSFPSSTHTNQLWSLALSAEFQETFLQNMKTRKFM